MIANWTLTRFCLAGGLLLVATGSQTWAQDRVGVVRIAAPRSTRPNSTGVQQTSFADRIDDLSDAAEGVAESLADATSRIENRMAENRNAVRNVAFGRHHRDAEPVVECPPAVQDDGTVAHGENCHCKRCRECRKIDRKLVKQHNPPCNAYGNCGPWCTGHSGHDMLCYFHSKFGFLCPSGNGGAGSPFCGSYSRVYPQDVGYFDGRDGQLYAAQGYGVPIAVPLAPTVGHTYNYSWGIPSSRLTPISHLAPR